MMLETVSEFGQSIIGLAAVVGAAGVILSKTPLGNVGGWVWERLVSDPWDSHLGEQFDKVIKRSGIDERFETLESHHATQEEQLQSLSVSVGQVLDYLTDQR